MSNIFKIIIAITGIAWNISCNSATEQIIANGQQPQIAIDNSGTIRIVYGNSDQIWCATSVDDGRSFPDTQLVGYVKDMHLGASRGPQVASSKNYTLVCAIDKKGMIHSFRLSHQSGKWTETAPVNDMAGSAPEGLMSAAADGDDHFYAVWLDIRLDSQNKICFASSNDQGATWSTNKVVYASPDRHVCECCKPTIAVDGATVAIMFRNWLNGSRDLYVTQSDNRGITFGEPVKQGFGTWKLNGCPMDGGGLTISRQTGIATVWQRNGQVYYAKPGEPEKWITAGRICSLSDPGSEIISWQNSQKLYIEELQTGHKRFVGEGGFIKTARTGDGAVLCAWENNGNIVVKRL